MFHIVGEDPGWTLGAHTLIFETWNSLLQEDFASADSQYLSADRCPYANYWVSILFYLLRSAGLLVLQSVLTTHFAFARLLALLCVHVYVRVLLYLRELHSNRCS